MITLKHIVDLSKQYRSKGTALKTQVYSTRSGIHVVMEMEPMHHTETGLLSL